VSEASPPTTPDDAVRVFIGLFILGYVLHGFETMKESGFWWNWIIAAVLVVLDYFWVDIRTALGVRFSNTAALVVADFRWWAGAIMLCTALVAIFPIIQQLKWPFSVSGVSQLPVDIHDSAKSPILGLDDAKRWHIIKSIQDISVTENGQRIDCPSVNSIDSQNQTAISLFSELYPLLHYSWWRSNSQGVQTPPHQPFGVEILLGSLREPHIGAPNSLSVCFKTCCQFPFLSARTKSLTIWSNVVTNA